VPRKKDLVTLDVFIDQYTDPRWCDLDARPKVAKAFQSLSDHLPDKIFNGCPRICFFAPAPGMFGLCTVLMPSAPSGEDAFIYLAPSLERESQAQVDFTVAHEFAHALLRHHLPGNDRLTTEELKVGYLNWNSERAADKLALEWGFTLPAYRKQKAVKGCQ
jgi:hypothetical protein